MAGGFNLRLRLLRRTPAPLAALLALVLAACANDRPARADSAPAPATQAALDAQAPDAAPAAPLPPPAPPEKAVVPKGCDINLGGRYKLSKKPFWAYDLEDDGVHVLAKRVAFPDAGSGERAPGEPGPAAPAMVLDRTANGFFGHELGFARSPSGTSCPVTFRAQVVACSPLGVTVRSEDTVDLDDQCRLRRPGAGATSEKVLVRQ